jgi:hypothetical protein
MKEQCLDPRSPSVTEDTQTQKICLLSKEGGEAAGGHVDFFPPFLKFLIGQEFQMRSYILSKNPSQPRESTKKDSSSKTTFWWHHRA